MTDPALAQLVTQFSRALKATRFYEKDHAIVVSLLGEAHKALEVLLRRGPFTLGAVGTTLLTAEGPIELAALREVASGLAGLLYQRSVVALRFEPGAESGELAALLSALAASPDDVRARGGVLSQLAVAGVRRIHAVEVELKALHRGEVTRLDELVGGDPVALAAVKRALQLEKSRKSGGEAIGVALPPDAGAAELGQYLGELVRRAEPERALGAPSAGLLRGAGGAPRAPEGKGALSLTADQLAGLASDAFDQVMKGPRVSTPADAQAALQQLGHALAQLLPEVRWKVLRRLAESEGEKGGPVEGMGKLLSDSAVSELIAAGLADQGDPQELAQLLSQMRPDGTRRGSVLSEAARAAGPGAAQLVQKLQSSVLAGGELAERYVPVPFRESLRNLQTEAQAARDRGAEAQDELSVLLRDADAVVTARYTAAAWVKLSRMEEGLARIDRAGQELIEWLESHDDFASGVKLAFALAESCEKASPPRPELIHKLFSGAAGVARAERLLVESAPMRPWLLVALEPLVFRGAKASVRPKLVAALSAQGDSILPRLRAHFSDATAGGLATALEIAAAVSVPKAVALCRELLRMASPEAKVAAVRALARLSADPSAVPLLAAVSGAEGDKASLAALRMEQAKDPAELHSLQREAALALGQCKSEAAVAPLLHALLRATIFGDKELELIRQAGASALAQLHGAGVGAARAALERGAREAKGKARELCARALEKRS